MQNISKVEEINQSGVLFSLALLTMQKIYYGTIDCLSLRIIFTPVNKKIPAQMSKCECK